jgi:hypothetical protein
MDFWKYGQILTIQKSLIIKLLRFWEKKFFIWVYHFALHYILNANNKFEMWINIIFSILWCFSQMNNPYFSTSKSIITNKWIFLLINNHTIIFINEVDRLNPNPN